MDPFKSKCGCGVDQNFMRDRVPAPTPTAMPCSCHPQTNLAGLSPAQDAIQQARQQRDKAFVSEFNRIQDMVHDCALAHGWWENQVKGILVENGQRIREVTVEIERNDGELLALMHSELSEALEALRHGNPADDKVPQFNGATAELADVIIRAMDMCARRQWPLAEAIVAKMRYNETRLYKHGKQF